MRAGPLNDKGWHDSPGAAPTLRKLVVHILFDEDGGFLDLATNDVTRDDHDEAQEEFGMLISGLLPALFASVAPPGSIDVPMKIGAGTFGVTIIAAIAAWSARETYRIHLDDLGNPKAVPAMRADYDQIRAQTNAAST